MAGTSQSRGAAVDANRNPVLGDQEPEHDHQGYKQEEARQELLIHVLGCPRDSRRRPSIIYVKCCGKYPKWKCSNSKRHLKATISKSKSLKSPSIFWLWPLALRTRRSLLSGILLPGAAPAIEWDDLVPADSSFANWTHLSVRSGLQPLMQTRPTEEMATQADDSVLGCVQAYIALEGTVLPPTFTSAIAAATRAPCT